MKKVFLFILVSLCLVGCTKQKRNDIALATQTDSSTIKELQAAVQQVNSACPMSAGDKNILEGAKFEKNKWYYYYTIEEDSIVSLGNEGFNEQIKKGLKDARRNAILASPSMKTMLDALVKVEADLIYEFKGNKTGQTIDVVFTYPELHVMADVLADKENK